MTKREKDYISHVIRVYNEKANEEREKASISSGSELVYHRQQACLYDALVHAFNLLLFRLMLSYADYEE